MKYFMLGMSVGIRRSVTSLPHMWLPSLLWTSSRSLKFSLALLLGSMILAPAHEHAHGATTEAHSKLLSSEPLSSDTLSAASPSWLAEIWHVMTFQGGYNTNVVITSTILLGIAAGIVGVFALLRKRSLVSDAVAHATLPGITTAFITATLLGMDGRTLPVLLSGAAISGVLSIIVIHLLSRWTRLREDAIIGIVLSVFFGAGTVMLSVIQTMPQGNSAGLMDFIFGQTAAMLQRDAFLMAGLAVTIIASSILFFKELCLCCFNTHYARVTGWPTTVIDMLIMSLMVLVTVAGLQAVGLMLVIALLIIPAVAARFWSEHLKHLVVIAAIMGGLAGYGGSVVSALHPGQPTGAIIVLICGVIFILSWMVAPQRGMIADLIRRSRIGCSVARDQLLAEAARHYLHDANNVSKYTEKHVNKFVINQAVAKSLQQRYRWNYLTFHAIGRHLKKHGYGEASPTA